MFKSRPKEPETDPLKRYKLEECLGSGAFASVYKSYDKQNKKTCAIKKMNKKSSGKFPMAEYHIGKNMKHPNVIRTLDCLCSSEHMYMHLELVNGGDLFTQLDPSGPGLEENVARKYMQQLASGLAYMHSQGYVHCDVKPENVLINSGVIKVCDLGLAGLESSERHGPATGTGAYMAPELVNRKQSIPYRIEFAQDVWSIGIVLYAVLFADLPWEKAKPRDKDFHLFCRKGGVSSRLHPFNVVTPPMRQFLGMLLNILPKHRPTMDQVVEFFDRKYAWYNGDKRSLKITYGLKEIKVDKTRQEKQQQQEKWKFDAGKTLKQTNKDAHSSSSSIPSMHENFPDIFDARTAKGGDASSSSSVLDHFDQLEIKG
eukprot:m.261328 g.261328  ORF g.261328 m.261328 type:complete len:371 (-) comp41902_c0_seq1:645-1757(-)